MRPPLQSSEFCEKFLPRVNLSFFRIVLIFSSSELRELQSKAVLTSAKIFFARIIFSPIPKDLADLFGGVRKQVGIKRN
jgi:hypothetical protein